MNCLEPEWWNAIEWIPCDSATENYLECASLWQLAHRRSHLFNSSKLI